MCSTSDTYCGQVKRVSAFKPTFEVFNTECCRWQIALPSGFYLFLNQLSLNVAPLTTSRETFQSGNRWECRLPCLWVTSFDELVLLTLDDIPTGCNLHLVALSLTASHRCNLTLGLLHKYDSEWYTASRASTIPHEQSQRSLDSITPCEFSVTGDYQLNRSLYLFLGLNRAHCSYNILANNQLNSPVLKSTRMEERDLFAYLWRRISWRPIVMYHFRGQSYLVRIVDSEQMAVK